MGEVNIKDPCNILVVEDNPLDVRAVKRAFQKNKLPHCLHFAKDGLEALDILYGKLGSFPTEQKTPKIVLLDLKMPRMGGLEFLAKIRSDSKLKSLPTVVLTTSTLESDIRAAFDFNVAGYIVKSLDFQDFVEEIATIDRYWTLSRL